MSNVTMPQPEFPGVMVGGIPRYLFTGNQMESYAAAKVREGLEEAEAKLMEMHEHAVKSRVPPDEDEDGWNTSCADRAIALGEAVLAIRALLPKQ